MIEIISMLPSHWPKVKTIYEEGIATGNATFETQAPSWEKWDAAHLPTCRFVAMKNGENIGWASLSGVSGRCVYAGVAEVSVYITAKAKGKNIGQQLLQALISGSEQNGFWTLQSGIFPENKASLHIHEKLGFRIIGFRENVGQMNGLWRDTILLERRSKIIGI